ncbi:MAG: hypothetical protein ABI162_17555 [Luteolibacter sp.]
MIDDNSQMIGFFVANQPTVFGWSEASKKLASDKSTLFREYIWGGNGIRQICGHLLWNTYGKDLILILFRFYVNPLQIQIPSLKEIEPYRGKEKAIGIPIIVNDGNFFDRSDEDRRSFLKNEILRKIDILEGVVKRRKLDTKID